MGIGSARGVGAGTRVTCRTLPQSFGFASAAVHSHTVDFCSCFCATTVAAELAAAVKASSAAVRALLIRHSELLERGRGAAGPLVHEDVPLILHVPAAP